MTNQRLIDASAILNEKGNSFKFGDETYYHESIIQNAPTVDAVPVVRCMKCRHAKQYSADGAVFWCGKNNLIKYGVFYCADGEKRS